MIPDRAAEPTEPLKEWVLGILNEQNKNVPDTLELEQVVNWAGTQGVSTLLFQALCGLAPKSELARHLSESNRQHVAQVMLLQEERQRVLKLLESFEPIILKGEALAYACYQHYYLRPMVDLDILVEAASYSEIEKTLISEGYSLTNSVGGHLVQPQTSFVKRLAGEIYSVIDIHAALFNRPALQHLLSYRDLLNNAARDAHPIGAIPCLGHLLIHASLHLLAHHANNPRLIWLYDIKLLLDQSNTADNQIVTSFCKRHNLSKVLLEAMESSLQAFPTKSPVPLIQSLKEQAGGESLNRFAAGLKHSQTRSKRVLEDWKSLQGGQQRGAWLRQHLFPPSEYMMQKYQLESKWRLPLFYLWRILRGSVKLIASK